MRRFLASVVTVLVVGTGLTVGSTSPASAAASCGSAYDYYKYSTTVAWWTVDVFRHENRTYACENDSVIYEIWEGMNNCSKYGWGVMYGSGKSYSFGGKNTPWATGTAACWMTVGGTIGGFGVTYSKQSNTQHAFYINGGNLWVQKSHWTTTP